VAGSCEHGNETLISIERQGFWTSRIIYLPSLVYILKKCIHKIHFFEDKLLYTPPCFIEVRRWMSANGVLSVKNFMIIGQQIQKLKLGIQNDVHIQQELFSLPASRWFLAWRILRSWRWGRHVSSKRPLTFNGLHGVVSQKIEFFITTAMKTSNPT
jgi:hypothetical protein